MICQSDQHIWQKDPLRPDIFICIFCNSNGSKAFRGGGKRKTKEIYRHISQEEFEEMNSFNQG